MSSLVITWTSTSALPTEPIGSTTRVLPSSVVKTGASSSSGPSVSTNSSSVITDAGGGTSSSCSVLIASTMSQPA